MHSSIAFDVDYFLYLVFAIWLFVVCVIVCWLFLVQPLDARDIYAQKKGNFRFGVKITHTHANAYTSEYYARYAWNLAYYYIRYIHSNWLHFLLCLLPLCCHIVFSFLFILTFCAFIPFIHTYMDMHACMHAFTSCHHHIDAAAAPLFTQHTRMAWLSTIQLHSLISFYGIVHMEFYT